jgi:uncharacterized protein with von Willebrand factor type A (vWA) domain
MLKKEETIIEKFKIAEDLRKLKDSWKKNVINDKYQQRIRELKAIEKVAELEIEAKIAWRFKEGRKAINHEKKLIESKIQLEMLKLKIKQDISKQKQKIKRTQKIIKPNKNPLPYIKNIIDPIESLDDSDSSEILEISLPKQRVGPRLYNKTPMPVKSILINTEKRDFSPDIKRINFTLFKK